MNLIDKWTAMQAVQGIDSVATLRDGDPVIRMSAVEHVLENLPETEPEHKTGRWIESNPQDSRVCRLMTCSECGKAYIVNINVPYEDWTEAHKFCVECGADMRGEAE